MATYFFETITAAQALAFTASSDTLVFGNTTSSGVKTSVVFNAATATSAATETVTDLVTGRSVVFGSLAAGEGHGTNGTLVFPDGTTLKIGRTGADSGDTTARAMFGCPTASSRTSALVRPYCSKSGSPKISMRSETVRVSSVEAKDWRSTLNSSAMRMSIGAVSGRRLFSMRFR